MYRDFFFSYSYISLILSCHFHFIPVTELSEPNTHWFCKLSLQLFLNQTRTGPTSYLYSRYSITTFVAFSPFIPFTVAVTFTSRDVIMSHYRSSDGASGHLFAVLHQGLSAMYLVLDVTLQTSLDHRLVLRCQWACVCG